MGNPKGQSTSTTTSGPPGPVMDDYYSAISRAQQVASTPYQQYQGNLVQGFSPDQLAAFQNVNNAQTAWQPYVNQAQQYATLGASPIQASAIQNYSNPYQQQVINATLGSIQNVDQQQQAQLVGNNLGNGGLFNDRLGVAQGVLAGQQDIANNQTLAGLNQSNYTQALGAAQADRSAAGQAAYTFGNLGSESLQNILQGSQAQLGTGGLQQQLGQAQLNVPYMQFQQAQAFPYQQTGWLAGIETGIGSNLGGNSTTVGTPAQPNPYAQYAGLGIAGLGAAGNLGWAPFAAAKRGGRIHGYADGGAPDGLSIPFGSAVPGMGGGQTPAIPYGGAMTYIPGGSQITRGSGPPGAPKGGGGAPAAATANPFADDIKALGSLGSHFKQPSDPGIQTGGASLGISPEQYATASDLGVSSLGNPDEGFYARGGPIKGDPRGIYVPRYARGGYAEGGAPDLGSPFNPEISPVLWPDSGSDSEAFSPRSLGEVAPAAIGPMPGPGAAPWGDLASAPIDASSFAKPSWAAALGASAAPSGPTGLSAGAYTSQETGQGFDVPPVAGQASLGAARSWPDNAVATGPGMAPPLEDKGSVATPPGGPSGPIPRVSVAGHGPAAVRANNPGAQYPSPEAARFGQQGYDVIGGGHKIAVFPSPVNGAAANMDLFARNYTGMTVGQAGAKWTGNSSFGVPGYDNRMVVTKEMMADPNFAIPFMKAIATREAGGANPMNDEEWNKAHEMFLAGGGPGEGGGKYAGATRTLGDAAALPPTARAAEASLGTPTHRGGWGSPEMSNALMAAGFSLMANKSPWLGQAVGNAGLAGLGTYTEAVRHGEATERQEHKEAREEKKVDLAQSKVDAVMKRMDAQHEASIAATNARSEATKNATRARDLAEQREQRLAEAAQKAARVGKIPEGHRLTDEGKLEPIPGYVEGIAAKADAKRPPLASLSPEQEEVQSNQVAQGNMSPLVGLPRTPEGLAVRNRLRTNAAQVIMRDHPEMTPSQVAEHLNSAEQEFKSRQIGVNSRARTAGNREANIEIILREARSDVPTALEASQKVTRYGGPLVPLNKLIQHGEVMSSNPEMVEFGMANLQLAEHWAKIMNPTGVMRESDRDLALKYLDTALSQGTYERAVRQLEKQMNKTFDAVRSMDPRTPLNPNAPAPPPGGEDRAMTDSDKAAMAWASAHPADPRAAAIRQHLGAP